jgi:hypothetical protein
MSGISHLNLWDDRVRFHGTRGCLARRGLDALRFGGRTIIAMVVMLGAVLLDVFAPP